MRTIREIKKTTVFDKTTKAKIKKSTLFYFLSLLFFLTGCASMNSSFDCPNKPGVTCRSLDQVNAMVDRGIIGKDSSSINKTSNSSLKTSFMVSTAMSNVMHPPRASEQLARIWIAPYQDIYGNYHGEEVIHVVVQKNHWAVPVEITGLKPKDESK